MRIIRGTHRGRRIIAPSSLPVRPTTDLAKESLFNILENNFYFDEVKVLDLFAGTGNISYEFASREAPMVTAVDIHPRCTRFISETAQKLGFSNLVTIRTTAESFLKKNNQKYDIIFADPPYGAEGLEDIIRLVFKRELLEPQGWMVMEHGADKKFDGFPELDQHRRYGNVHFSIFSYLKK